VACLSLNFYDNIVLEELLDLSKVVVLKIVEPKIVQGI